MIANARGMRPGDWLRTWRASVAAHRPTVLLADVPYYPQGDDSSCGPACLRMVANYYGRRTRLPTVAPATGMGSRGMLRAIARAGLRAVRPPHQVKARTLGPVLRLVDRGIPVIMAFGDGSTESSSHYAVLVGYSRTTVFFHDPFLRPFFPRARHGFGAKWRRESNWYVGVVPAVTGPGVLGQRSGRGRKR